MASTGPPGAQARPDVGDILIVIHDFLARSSDELSLAKGDRVELIERDDEFGDGWFLGRHMANGNSGLFPEVYTRPAPKGTASPPSITPNPARNPPSSANGVPARYEAPASSTTTAVGRGSTSRDATSALPAEANPVTLPLSSAKIESKPSPTAAALPVSKGNSIASILEDSQRLQSQNQDSPVLHETLTVIDEHITDLHSAPNSGAINATTDSSSEYSSHVHDRLSYIQGEETDEEEEVPHTRAEVEAWSADQVAEYLFTAGVEKKHCEVFRDQEIAGEVLLGMDQSSLFLKAFDLGSVGRRLKTWQKIKCLQDEVNGHGVATRRNTQTFSDAGSEDSRGVRIRSRANTLTNSTHRFPHAGERPSSSAHSKRLSQTPKLEGMTSTSPISPRQLQDSPTAHQKRPSAASVRDLHHSRRHSSTDYRLRGSIGGPTPVNAGTPKIMSSGTFPLTDGATHKKQPSFDRNWTMGSAATAPRPLSSTGLEDIVTASNPDLLKQPSGDVDRGYFSGTEVDGRKQRNVLKKRDSTTGHSRNSSYAEQQRVRSATATTRQSRYGSMDSPKPDSLVSGAAQKYHGLSVDHRRTASGQTKGSTADGLSPTVTKLDEGNVSPASASNRQAVHGDWFSKPAAQIAGLSGLRAISDAVTRNERTKLGSPTDASVKESPRSSTPSAGPSFELDSPVTAKSPLSATTTSSRKSGKKTKKDTSAYQRGLLRIGPREAVKDADYSGWMKKKSSHLMTTWKPRFFVLKGRRLAYYYSEDDVEEKGLIDISFHRVLAADNEKLQGLHATLTGASNTPITPADSNLAIHTDNDAGGVEKGTDSVFIFKLVPPRAGLTKAVNFTKPMVHYFAVPNLQLGRAWMAALVKATIDRDDTQPMTSTYQQKTISLAKARAMHHRPPALMNLDDKVENGANNGDEKKEGLGISFGEVDSAVSGLGKLSLLKGDNASKTAVGNASSPQAA
ncbi:hypothetical protein DL768_009467 [Monosporascus sp. mg162]|nr:hypothetical protein DL768_009467 [Monosporascus sp. mg162]